MPIYEPHVTPDDINHIRKHLNKCTLNILHDDGLYRHLHCYWKDDPYGQAIARSMFTQLPTPSPLWVTGCRRIPSAVIKICSISATLQAANTRIGRKNSKAEPHAIQYSLLTSTYSGKNSPTISKSAQTTVQTNKQN